ncbi:HIRAN domain-containing protein [Methylovulum miyakonense]|uniref:HIRAN domain-containing protein n=1 Tax=Methylovulum miyakonense TaxID=645578 RepID=UPI00039E1485|nr:HIRAN domain-containing protein [Methylovulum miyakonense]
MNPLYIAWQDPKSRLWHTVGRLSRERDLYTFAYTQGALASPHFKYLGRMRDVYKTYYSQELFPLFANRILNSSRPEYPDYVRWLAMNPDKENDPMQLLARSGGERATDELYVYTHPETNDQGELELFFLSNGLRHLDPASLQRIGQLQMGDSLALRREAENEHDRFALVIETDEPIKVGYCPRYLNRDLCQIMENTTIKLTVERLNHDAPIQFRLLCKALFKLPPGFTLFGDDEYQLLGGEVVAA